MVFVEPEGVFIEIEAQLNTWAEFTASSEHTRCFDLFWYEIEYFAPHLSPDQENGED